MFVLAARYAYVESVLYAFDVQIHGLQSRNKNKQINNSDGGKSSGFSRLELRLTVLLVCHTGRRGRGRVKPRPGQPARSSKTPAGSSKTRRG
jgi:hypothetical protein